MGLMARGEREGGISIYISFNFSDIALSNESSKLSFVVVVVLVMLVLFSLLTGVDG